MLECFFCSDHVAAVQKYASRLNVD